LWAHQKLFIKVPVASNNLSSNSRRCRFLNLAPPMIDGKQDVSNANELQITSSRFHVNQPLWKKANRLEIAAAISFICFFFVCGQFVYVAPCV